MFYTEIVSTNASNSDTLTFKLEQVWSSQSQLMLMLDNANAIYEFCRYLKFIFRKYLTKRNFIVMFWKDVDVIYKNIE